MDTDLIYGPGLIELQEAWWGFQWRPVLSKETQRLGEITVHSKLSSRHTPIAIINIADLVWSPVWSCWSCINVQSRSNVSRRKLNKNSCWQNKSLRKMWWRQLKEQRPMWPSRYSLFVMYHRQYFSDYQNGLHCESWIISSFIYN